MFYLKLFIIYSILGFTFESFVYKITNINKHSGVLYGPYTLVYGIGSTLCYYLSDHLNISNGFKNVLLSYLGFVITCTLIELITGYLIKIIYKFDSWDYSYRKYHLGKYISFDYALVWGILSYIFTKCLHSFFFEITNFISNTLAIVITSIIFFDIIFTFIKTKK